MNSAIDLSQLNQFVVQPVLNAFGAPYNSQAAARLLIGTALHESDGGQYLAQVGSGPALGAWQMEPFTHDDCWDNFLKYQPALAAAVNQFAVPNAGAGQMAYNLAYSCAMARVKYIRAPSALPNANDFEGLANYYKVIYNSELGAATVDPNLVACFSTAATVC